MSTQFPECGLARATMEGYRRCGLRDRDYAVLPSECATCKVPAMLTALQVVRKWLDTPDWQMDIPEPGWYGDRFYPMEQTPAFDDMAATVRVVTE